MNYTENLSLGLPEYGESADVAALNRNSGILDAYVYNTRQMECEPYDSTKTYMSGDLSIHNEVIYECNTDNTTGAWDDSKWDSTTLAEQIAKAKQMGGESALADLEDVEITNPSTGQALLFDDDDDVWKNQNLPDVSVTKEASGNPVEFSDGADAPIVKCVSEIQGSQDLHGYDKPWVGGAGKNKLPLVLTTMQAANTEGTWNADGTYTLNQVTWSIIYDDMGQITSIKASGQASVTSSFIIPISFDADTMLVNGCPANGSESTYYIVAGTINTRTATDIGTGATISGTTTRVVLRVATGFNAQNIVYYPMLRTSGDATYEPYSNICPITAYTEGEIEVRGKNLFGFNKTFTDKTAEYRHQSTQRLNIVGNSDNSITCAFNGGTWSFGYLEFSGIDGTRDYAISYKVKDNNTSFTPSIGKGLESDSTKLVIVVNGGNGNVSTTSDKHFTLYDIQIEVGTTESDYVPFVAYDTHTTTFPSAIYRGSEDVVNGEVTSDMPMIDLGDLTWSYNSTLKTFYTNLSDAKGYTKSQIASAISSAFSCVANNSIENDLTLDGVFSIHRTGTSNWLNVRYLAYTSTSDFTTAVTGFNLAYELENSTTASITVSNAPVKSLSGYNHIESSTGDMEVEYITENYQPLVDLIESNKHVYSTQEQIVGTWIDGSTVYERTISTALVTGSAQTVQTGISNADKIVYVDGKIIDANGINLIPHGFLGQVPQYSWILYDVGRTDFKYNASTYLSGTVYVTLRYTKSTTTRSLSAPVTSQKAQIEPLTAKEEEVPTEEEKAVNEEENTNENR